MDCFGGLPHWNKKLILILWLGNDLENIQGTWELQFPNANRSVMKILENGVSYDVLKMADYCKLKYLYF